MSLITPIPNGPFYSDPTNYINSPQGYLVVGTGLSVTADGTLLAASAAGGTVTSVQAGLGLNGGTITTNGVISLKTASDSVLGGIKVGANLTIAADGTLNALPPGAGTITGVTTGVGLSGGGITGAVAINLIPAGKGVIGGVSIGDGIDVAGGSISVPPASEIVAGGVVLASSAEVIAGTDAEKAITPATLSAKVASLTESGIVRLSDDLTVGDSTVAATQTAAKTAYDVAVAAQTTANAALPASGGTMTGAITFDASQTFPATNLPVATTTSLGAVQIGSGLAIDGTGVLSAITGTVAAVTAGPGLGAPVTGNTITSTGTISLLPPSGTSLGGVKAGANISIAADGTISIPSSSVILSNNPFAYTSYVWPIPRVAPSPLCPGDVGQVLSIANATTGELAWVDSNSLTSVVAGTGISVTASASSATVSLAVVPSIVAGAYGGTGLIPTIQVNSYGQVTSVGEANPYVPFLNATIASLDFASNNTNWTWTLTGNTNVSNPLNAQPGQTGTLVITQDPAIAYTLTWGAAWKFADGTPYSGNPTPAAVDLLEFVVVASNYIVVTNVVSNIG
jgi:hypothetical protein